ncbi:MAG: polysaccharide deacetylase family protein [Anaerolineaceae bacterium]|nr:polysaccharide deacetylase family protein [Anaerolineaceae bacterium]
MFIQNTDLHENKKSSRALYGIFFTLLTALLLFTMGGCQLVDSIRPTPDTTAFFEQALLTATYAVPSVTMPPTAVPSTATPVPTETAIPTETPTLGPPPDLPSAFNYDSLEIGSIPQTYIDNTCEVLAASLNPENALSGTVVMPIMYHSVTENGVALAADGSQVNQGMLEDLLTTAKSMGFETITMQEMVNFVEQNAYIPQRSLLLIIDDRRPGVFRTNFFPLIQEYDWEVSLAWPIADTDIKGASYINTHPEDDFATLWEQMEAYYQLGYFDVQSHGYVHNINTSEYSTDEFMLHEMADSRTVLQEHFYCKDAEGQAILDCNTVEPLAYIWPGGGFTLRGAEIARESGFHVGFTTHPRGPIMFNWVPLAAEKDPNRPFWVPEIPAGDPLMTLPRYWSLDAVHHLEEVAAISEAAAAYAAENHQAYVQYYQYYCQNDFGALDLE